MAKQFEIGSKIQEPAQAGSAGWLNLAAVMAALGASVCCVGPFLLVLLGVGGGWMSTLVAFSPLRPWFIGLAVLALAWAYYKLYWVKPCEQQQVCANPDVRRRQRWIFWIVTGLVLGLIGFPWFAPLFLQ